MRPGYCSLRDKERAISEILAVHVRLKVHEEQDRSEHSPVHRLVARRIQDTVDTRKRTQAEWIGVSEGPTLILKRSVEPGIEGEGASTKRRLSAELFEHKLLKIARRQQRRVYVNGNASDHAPMRGHFVMGHWKHRKTGLYFWHPHKRGDFKRGRIEKDYEVI